MKMSIARKGKSPVNKGKKSSLDTRAKQSAAALAAAKLGLKNAIGNKSWTGKKRCSETCAKLSMARKKLIAAGWTPPNKGVPWSDAQRTAYEQTIKERRTRCTQDDMTDALA